MTVQIQVRDDNGRYTEASHYEFALAALRHIARVTEGWTWLRSCLCRFCILQAENCASNHVQADRWYARYQALRDIG